MSVSPALSSSTLPSKKIVAIGGGHGLGRVLASLSHYEENITGIVTTTDNGGSTGRIRDCQGGIAWGDTRNCINQLITEPSISSMMFEYRFKGEGELDGHNLGNLMLTALDNLSVRPLDAINLIRNILNVKAQILPMSEYPSDLAAMLPSGKVVCGETSVDELDDIPAQLYLEPQVPAITEAITAIEHADLVILGPGSFFTSILPPLLLRKIAFALSKTSAKLVFISNLAQEEGPAGQLSMSQMIEWCERKLKSRKIDIIISPTEQPELKASGYQVNVVELASRNQAWRHNREKLSAAIEACIE
ncbi:uridine diphosphate-N-acetylglucosamine-binding protein YvcK [Vibrio sp. SS-MA-C1-2]|uniref:uridine diphosphate-N-acetylglucosamine-binding protein YvcK n=1 Tax=Vibrio sp. SS-MA-C1-2 TaxID=2908646 RepID=UPI001F40C335|nr:uridine diphosphate-N-acetylglucosamine-binding protein YvcK [Vibrio sp. SS-MA-C1-2]UJF18704.1 uridine diphosphate-N-acetylglucosamine-binding protein YvcK [Vibrio sp. SS-MA-C1-2]